MEVIDRFHKLKSRVAPAAQPEYRPREANFLADFLAGEASGSLKGADKAPVNQPVKCCRLEVNMPYELLLRHQAIIIGPHQYGRTVLALREVPSCPVVLVEKFAASQGNRQAALLRQLVTATQRLTKPLCVEYIAAAEDGMGRLYARQISAQSPTKEARYLLYGQNHKEVDMSGAHYELLRRCVGVSRLPPIAQLREAIWTESQGIVQDPHAFAKHLPLRLLNTNAGSTLAFAKEQGYIPGGASLPSFGRLRILGTTTFRQCCKSIAQAWRSPSVIGAITRKKQSRATLCNSSTGTLFLSNLAARRDVGHS